jgi:hypothetical protein
VIPLGGTVTRPKLEFDAAVKDLAKGLVKDLAKDALSGKLKDVLDEKLGKGDDDPSAVSPEALLKRADELWKAGDKAAAAPLYRELRDKHKLTLLYLRNRGKIEDRSDWKP